MDLLFETLPESQNRSLFELISLSRGFFTNTFPLNNFFYSGEECNITFKHGSWIYLAIKELLFNAAEAAGPQGEPKLTWKQNSVFEFKISNTGERFPISIPTAPPQPFYTEKNRHEGLGLAIVNRICSEMGGILKIEAGHDHLVIISLKLRLEDTFDEGSISTNC